MTGAVRIIPSQPLGFLAPKTASGGKIRAHRVASEKVPRNRLYRLGKIPGCKYDPTGPHILGNTIGNAVAAGISGSQDTSAQGQGGGIDPVDQAALGASLQAQSSQFSAQFAAQGAAQNDAMMAELAASAPLALSHGGGVTVLPGTSYVPSTVSAPVNIWALYGMSQPSNSGPTANALVSFVAGNSSSVTSSITNSIVSPALQGQLQPAPFALPYDNGFVNSAKPMTIVSNPVPIQTFDTPSLPSTDAVQFGVNASAAVIGPDGNGDPTISNGQSVSLSIMGNISGSAYNSGLVITYQTLSGTGRGAFLGLGAGPQVAYSGVTSQDIYLPPSSVAAAEADAGVPAGSVSGSVSKDQDGNVSIAGVKGKFGPSLGAGAFAGIATQTTITITPASVSKGLISVVNLYF